MTEAPPAPAVPTAAKTPNVLWAILAAFCPFAACPVTPVVTLAAAGGRSEPWRLVQEGGFMAYATLATFVLACLVLMTLSVFLARGTKVPVTVMMFVSALPWLVGVAGMRVGMHQVMGVLSSVDPSMKATLLAQGIAEASSCRLLGTFLTSGLCAATALALGLSAISTSDKPSSAGLLAMLAGVPVLGACLLVPNFRELGPVAFVVVLPALAFVLAAGLGGLGVAGGARPAVVVATLGIPATLAVTALARGVGVAGMIHLFQALASISADDKGVIMAAGAAELASADKLAVVAGALGALGALALAAFAFTRTTNKRTVLIEVGLCAAIAVLAVGSDASAVGAASKAMNGLATEPWTNVPGFQPLHAEGAEGSDAWVLTNERLSSPSGESIDAPLSEAGLTKLTAKLSSLRDTSTRWDRASEVHLWSVAVDQRVSKTDFAKLVEAARAAKLDQLLVVGRGAERPDTGSSAAWWIGLLGTTGGQAFWLQKPPDEGEPKPVKLLTAQDLTQPSSSLIQAALDPAQFSPQQLIDAAAKLQREGRGHPMLVNARQLSEPTATGDGPPPEGVVHRGLGGVVRDDPDWLPNEEAFDSDDAEAKEPVGTGRNDKKEIARTMATQRDQLKYCYEKRLTTNPKLEGKVTFQIGILSSGKVKSVTVTSSTLADKEAEACMVSRLKAMMFSNKPGAGLTLVSYPFIFKAR